MGSRGLTIAEAGSGELVKRERERCQFRVTTARLALKLPDSSSLQTES